jgi:hypothetical protein
VAQSDEGKIRGSGRVVPEATTPTGWSQPSGPARHLSMMENGLHQVGHFPVI